MFWMSQYYFAPLGKTLRLVLPGISSSIIQPKQHYRVLLKQSKAKTKEIILSIQKESPAQAATLKHYYHVALLLVFQNSWTRPRCHNLQSIL